MKAKNNSVLFLCILVGLTLGNFVGELCRNIPYLNVITYGEQFGIEEPLVVNLGIIVFSLKVMVNITVAGILGIGCGILFYKKV